MTRQEIEQRARLAAKALKELPRWGYPHLKSLLRPAAGALRSLPEALTNSALTQFRTPIGIDLGGYAAKAVQLERTRTGWRVRAAVSVALPVPNHPLDIHTVRFLQETLYRQGFESDRVVLAAPTAQLQVDTLEVPPRSSGAPVEQIARLELARSTKLDPTSFELGCWDLPASTRAAATGGVMAVALKHEHANALLDPFVDVGFDVIALDTKSWALARAAAAAHADPQGIVAVLDIGWNGVVMVLVQDGVVAYQRMLGESGIGILLRAVRDEFQLADDEAEYVLKNVGAAQISQAGQDFAQAQRIAELVKRFADSVLAEIQPAFDYASHRYAEKPLGSLLLCGGGATIAGLPELLERKTSLKTSLLCPATLVECPAGLTQLCSDGVLTTSLGLALHGAD